jgi:hypothetical protein
MRNQQLRQARDQFAALLENPDSPEREWQKLFTNSPFILTDCLRLGIAPQQLIPCKTGRAEADFYFFPETEDPLSPFGVIEVKRPNTPILRVPRKDVICLSAKVTDAVAQAQKYATELKAEIVNSRSQLVIFGNLLHMIVIAGLSGEIARKVTMQLHSSQVANLLPPECRLVCFDELFQSLASKVPPVFHVVDPWYHERHLPLESSTRFSYAVEYECALCGEPIPITRLPFEPSPGVLNRVVCAACNRKRRGLRGSPMGSPDGAITG